MTGSTPAQNVKDTYAQDVQLQEFDTYSACVEALRNGAVDAVTTDDIILAGYAAQSPGDFKVVGEPFTEELYGIGLAQGDDASRTAINDAIEEMIASGAWAEAFEPPSVHPDTRCRIRRPSIGTDPTPRPEVRPAGS